MSGSKPFSRRDFMKVTTGTVGGLIAAALGAPLVGYLIDPALKAGAKDAWITVGKLEKIAVNVPTPFSFTLTSVNGWERTGTSHGGYVIRRSEDPTDILILSSRCTHLGCTVNWSEDSKSFVCPCHDASFGAVGEVLGGPPPEPLERFEEFKVDENGDLLIFFKEA